jgi:hypothetical protein
MYLLYNDDFAPMTSTIGFLATTIERAVQTFEDWTSGLLKTQRGASLCSTPVEGALSAALPRLLPLVTPGRTRSLLVPTQGEWVAYLDNSILGSDASPIVSHMSLLIGCRSVRMTAIDAERESQRKQGRRDSAVIFEIFEGHNTEWLNQLRSVSMLKDGRWSFEIAGTPQPFEEPENYKKQRVQDRFTIEMLDRYLRALGIRAFDEQFYLPNGSQAILFEETGAMSKGKKEYDLDGAFLRHDKS